jgi:predicted DNA-binding ribbon-helix-helix protein
MQNLESVEWVARDVVTHKKKMREVVDRRQEWGSKWLTAVEPFCYHVIKSDVIGGIMVRTQIQLTDDQAKALKKIAQSRRLSVAELIRKAVDTIIKSSPVVDREERRKRAMEIAGKFSSGKRDISKKHDLYLTDAYNK